MADFLASKNIILPKRKISTEVLNFLGTNVLTNGTAADAMLWVCLSELQQSGSGTN